MAAYQDYTESQLASLLSTGDHAAYTEVYKRYSGILFVHAFKKLKDEEEARDVIQELFTVLWEKHTEIKIKTTLSGYLYTSTRNLVLRKLTRRSLESSYHASLEQFMREETAVTDHAVRERELAAIIETQIDLLPAKMRRVFTMSRQLYFSHKEIGERLEISETTVKKQVSNALRILRAKLEALLA